MEHRAFLRAVIDRSRRNHHLSVFRATFSRAKRLIIPREKEVRLGQDTTDQVHRLPSASAATKPGRHHQGFTPPLFLAHGKQDCCTIPLLGPPVVTKTRRGKASPNRDLPLLSAPLVRRGCLLSEAIRLLQRSRSDPSRSQAESPARVPTSR